MTDARRRTLLFTALAVALAWSGWLAFNGNPEDEAADLVKGVDGPATRMNTPVPPVARPAKSAASSASPAKRPARRLRQCHTTARYG
mgnify:CR=1 FL=1